ncbi:enoyl-CoA hydratase-related protein [Myxococcota bacterium]|nr:enoyl-CoA hydratase-related protein [Myxococcota bacterium]
MAYENLRYEVEDHIATVTLDRPETLNALNRALLAELGEVGNQIDEDPEVRVVIVTGAGRGFCSGGDLKETSFAAGTGGSVVQNPADHWAGRWMGLSKPTLAAVNGVAAGGGLALALACDIRLASDQARFAALFARIGMSVLDGAGWLLQRAVGLSRALELLFTAETIDAERALEIGLVGHVVPHDELLERTRDLAQRIAANPPVALQLTKQVVHGAHDKTFPDHLPSQWAAMQTNLRLARHDIAEGGQAFREKRAANFRGLVPPDESD